MKPNSTHSLLIRIQSRSEKSIETELRLKFWSESERRIRALKVLGFGFLLTLAFVFLPIAHFILVPMGLIVTPLAAFKVSKLETVIPEQILSCPHCGAAFQFPFRFDLDADMQLQCGACREILRISRI